MIQETVASHVINHPTIYLTPRKANAPYNGRKLYDGLNKLHEQKEAAFQRYSKNFYKFTENHD